MGAVVRENSIDFTDLFSTLRSGSLRPLMRVLLTELLGVRERSSAFTVRCRRSGTHRNLRVLPSNA